MNKYTKENTFLIFASKKAPHAHSLKEKTDAREIFLHIQKSLIKIKQKSIFQLIKFMICKI